MPLLASLHTGHTHGTYTHGAYTYRHIKQTHKTQLKKSKLHLYVCVCGVCALASVRRVGNSLWESVRSLGRVVPAAHTLKLASLVASVFTH